MNLQNYYYSFPGVLSTKFCNELIQFGLSKQEKLALTGGFEDKNLSQKEIKDLKKKRNSNIVWLNDPWIYRQIIPYVWEANEKAGWNFDLELSEDCQFTKYKINQYYDWHCDSWSKAYDRPGKWDHGKIRKLSVTCQLTDGSEYTGGELQFDFRNYEPDRRKRKLHEVNCQQIYKKGSIVVFPSHVWHRVKPVTQGTRYSLVIWTLGKPFK